MHISHGISNYTNKMNSWIKGHRPVYEFLFVINIYTCEIPNIYSFDKINSHGVTHFFLVLA